MTLLPSTKFQIDFVRRDFDLPVAAGNAGQHKNSVLAQSLHGIERHARVTGAFEDEVERPVFLWHLRRSDVSVVETYRAPSSSMRLAFK